VVGRLGFGARVLPGGWVIAVKNLPRATGNSADSIARDEACRPIAPLKSQGCDVRRVQGRKSQGMCVRGFRV